MPTDWWRKFEERKEEREQVVEPEPAPETPPEPPAPPTHVTKPDTATVVRGTIARPDGTTASIDSGTGGCCKHEGF